MTELKKLGKYEIRGELGQGAMGIVYDGFDPMIGRRVALKTVRRDQLDRAEVEEILARFKREAQAAGRLSHPNIVSIYEYGEDNGTAFIAMEFVEGRELKEHFDANERFPMAEIVRIMGQLLDALEAYLLGEPKLGKTGDADIDRMPRDEVLGTRIGQALDIIYRLHFCVVANQ